MSQLSITLLRLGFLVLLWLLVLSSIGVLRADLYGTRVTERGRGRKATRVPDAVVENRSITRLVTSGASIASPLATTRTALTKVSPSALFSRKPEAPSCSAS